MTQKEIEKAAVDSCVFENSIFNPDLTPFYEKGFGDGAQWRINSIWHRTDNEQAPEEGKPCLLEVESYEEDGERYIDHVSSQWSHFGWTDDFLKIIKRRSEGRYRIIRWVYIEDLLPIKED